MRWVGLCLLAVAVSDESVRDIRRRAQTAAALGLLARRQHARDSESELNEDRCIPPGDVCARMSRSETTQDIHTRRRKGENTARATKHNWPRVPFGPCCAGRVCVNAGDEDQPSTCAWASNASVLLPRYVPFEEPPASLRDSEHATWLRRVKRKRKKRACPGPAGAPDPTPALFSASGCPCGGYS